MKLYKNVDICDLESIMKSGILSMSDCGNNNWEDGKRSDNDTSVVYLFSPIAEINTFPNYGIALLEVECDATENIMSELDVNKGNYIEYITKDVKPEQIKKIIIPKVFKSRIDLPESIKVTWCEMSVDEYDKYDAESGHSFYKNMSQDRLEDFAKTMRLNTGEYCFFRGIEENGKVIDLYNVKYIW